LVVLFLLFFEHVAVFIAFGGQLYVHWNHIRLNEAAARSDYLFSGAMYNFFSYLLIYFTYLRTYFYYYSAFYGE